MYQNGLSQQDILNRVMDAANNALRVALSAQLTGVQQEVVMDQADDSVQVCPYRGTLTDRSGSASTSSAQVAAANTSRKYFFIQNLDSSIVIYVNFGADASSTNSYKLTSGQSLVFEGSFIPTSAINVIAASGTPAYMAKEGS